MLDSVLRMKTRLKIEILTNKVTHQTLILLETSKLTSSSVKKQHYKFTNTFLPTISCQKFTVYKNQTHNTGKIKLLYISLSKISQQEIIVCLAISAATLLTHEKSNAVSIPGNVVYSLCCPVKVFSTISKACDRF